MNIRRFASLLIHTPLHPQWLLRRRQPPKGIEKISGVILDVGSADSWLKPYLRSQSTYVALDTPAIGAARYGAKPTVFADGTALPFANDSIDCVACLEVLEHVVRPEILLSEIHRVLKPNGQLFLTMPFLYPVHDAPYDYQRYTNYGLQQAAAVAGFDSIAVECTLSAIRTAGIQSCLSLAGPLSSGGWRLLLIPMAALLVFLINMAAFVLDFFWPKWDAMTYGYQLHAKKP